MHVIATWCSHSYGWINFAAYLQIGLNPCDPFKEGKNVTAELCCLIRTRDNYLCNILWHVLYIATHFALYWVSHNFQSWISVTENHLLNSLLPSLLCCQHEISKNSKICTVELAGVMYSKPPENSTICTMEYTVELVGGYMCSKPLKCEQIWFPWNVDTMLFCKADKYWYMKISYLYKPERFIWTVRLLVLWHSWVDRRPYPYFLWIIIMILVLST